MKGFLAALVLLAWTATAYGQTVEQKRQYDETALLAFGYVCEAMTKENPRWNCEGLQPPTVVVTKLLQIAKVAGMYVAGESYVFVSPEGPHPEQTIVHEITHYVAWYNGVTDRCFSEALARKVANDTYTDWRGRYGCEQGE